MRLKDKVAVITGAGKGIGAAIAKRFAAEGAKVILVDRDESSVRGTAAAIVEVGGTAAAYTLDISDRPAIDRLVEEVVTTYGTIDILVNNAGVVRDAMLHKMKEEDWDMVININLKGAFNMVQAVLGIMREKNYGKIINVSSASRFGNVGQTNYAASKEALVGFTRSLAKEAGSKGINVNAIAPGTIETDMYYGIPENIRDMMKLITPLGRPGKPEEVANLCLFLASDESSYITGQVIHCDGGIFMP
ncbi:MAG TPA: 3-oxoacyl-ACP reductase FabG [Syntrophomonadaceae bacterium]|nr:3-oxoacyl-ACP reductase FabG [Syntrophomonadaceae bacterium]HQA08517.1 3-oxoacyl-ACP reductase FabG [Syntrophomonadaceae bacterium]HQE24287.1 3-oxoacyl-ACP reductase FabG [Syntrophomonadaceae bacterium]